MQTHYQKAVSRILPQTLYVVATPIGNLSDITLHALAVLGRADLICAEDTRVTQQLLRAFGINTRLLSVREQNEQSMADKVIEALSAGLVVAQVSDAGTPAVCDPGARLVTRVREAGFRVVPTAGISAVMATLSVAGVVQSDFYFAGFLPPKSQERQRWFARWQEADYAVVMFETPHRIERTLSEMAHCFPNRRLVFARELTKSHETILCGTVSDIQAAVSSDSQQKKGEMVLVLHPCETVKNQELSASACQTLILLSQELPLKRAAALTAEIYNTNKKALYDWAIQQKLRTQE
ncbi:16S rRNA (cytidine(1402)-2'-O)-methyltransferase [Stenoxybacter acetivorans]|uniref:16S rRNA (cytidine(1402)-2'-O)-methyltransferase n=1 Tax=Stenoxybacter acetivorans TaxID=422441 RepID=UPI000565B7EB|nr:16S rRNA (cytidine(1402)-2'-O)-methyltransferase [Stenoxybacter acetivorans]